MELQRVPVGHPSFADLRGVISGLDSVRLGYDPLINNPCDPWGRRMNYPRIWLLLEKTNITQRQTVPIGMALAVIFYVCTIVLLMPKINVRNSILWIFLILSPAVTLSVERGNSDLVIFILFCLSLVCFKNRQRLLDYFSYLLIYLAAVLKLFPVFAFWAFFKEKRGIFWLLSITFGTAFLFYIAYSYNDLKLIYEITPKGINPMAISMAYGNMVVFHYIHRYILEMMMNISTFPAMKICAWLFTLVFTALAFLYFRKKTERSVYLDRSYITSFRIGAAVFAGTFLLGNNWDYRYIFLLFTIPQLINWSIKSKKNLAIKALWFTLISMWSIFWLSILKLPYNMGVLLDEAFNWLLFVILFYLLIITSNDIFKNLLTTQVCQTGYRNRFNKK